MLKNRIIPVLLLKDGRLVKTIRFDSYRDVGNPITTAKIYDAQRADELIFLDIGASKENRATLVEIVKEVSAVCFMPLGVGGGIRTLDDIRTLLHSGADKVVINTAAFEESGFIEAAAERFGSSTITVSIDARKKNDGSYEVYVRGATKATGYAPVTWAQIVEKRGAGEIVITAVDRDGTMEGLDVPLIRSVADAVQVPIIAAGGVSSLADFQKGFEEGHASGIGAGSIFHFTDQSIIKTRTHLVNSGINVRK